MNTLDAYIIHPVHQQDSNKVRRKRVAAYTDLHRCRVLLSFFGWSWKRSIWKSRHLFCCILIYLLQFVFVCFSFSCSWFWNTERCYEEYWLLYWKHEHKKSIMVRPLYWLLTENYKLIAAMKSSRNCSTTSWPYLAQRPSLEYEDLDWNVSHDILKVAHT